MKTNSSSFLFVWIQTWISATDQVPISDDNIRHREQVALVLSNSLVNAICRLNSFLAWLLLEMIGLCMWSSQCQSWTSCGDWVSISTGWYCVENWFILCIGLKSIMTISWWRSSGFLWVTLKINDKSYRFDWTGWWVTPGDSILALDRWCWRSLVQSFHLIELTYDCLLVTEFFSLTDSIRDHWWILFLRLN